MKREVKGGRAAVLMIQGTASSAGKSLTVTGLCRRYARLGYRVLPFKAQNMALNSFVTKDGLEIGRAQAVQADAAGVDARVEMNPILLKPEGNSRSQVVVNGKPIGAMPAVKYYEIKRDLSNIVREALDLLRADCDLVIIEGAGSPAEINLRSRDIVNMHVAHMADAPVLLVGDIDRGGVFAHFFGTLGLLDDRDRARVKGLVINKFRGDIKILDPGLDMIEERTGVPVLGVIPFVPNLRIADEDSVSLDHRMLRERGTAGEVDIAVVRLPRISNYDDVLALEHEAGVVVRFVESVKGIEGADLVILPGTKDTRSDLAWLESVGLGDAIRERAKAGGLVLGICGGFQMLGQTIQDPDGVEGEPGETKGLGLLPISTRFVPEKCTRQVQAEVIGAAPLTPTFASGNGLPIQGYEIHQGRVLYGKSAQAWFQRSADSDTVESRTHAQAGDEASTWNEVDEGCWQGSVSGTLLHGIFESEGLRHSLLAALGWTKPEDERAIESPLAEYDRLADALEASMDFERIDSMLENQGLVLRGKHA